MTFPAIYERNGWNGIESKSGPGSGFAATHNVAALIELLIQARGIKSVLNVACGDDYWMPDLPGYLGVDIVPEAIERARRFHPERNYQVRDARELEHVGDFDLVICRDAMQHMPLADGVVVLERLQSVAGAMLVSTYLGMPNIDVPEGYFFSPDLTAAPFNLPQPELFIFDGWDYDTGNRVRDPSKFLGLWS